VRTMHIVCMSATWRGASHICGWISSWGTRRKHTICGRHARNSLLVLCSGRILGNFGGLNVPILEEAEFLQKVVIKF
jgi:hypothetical protein